MNKLKLSENITKFRKLKKVTQEELADYIGVTKASVSKWETGQCMPDLMLLPELASYFDVSLDELIGYEPQITQEQIRKLYLEYTSDFVSKPFDEVYNKIEINIKKYYSCYSFIFQMAILYLNHYDLSGNNEKSKKIIDRTLLLCDHIINCCHDTDIVSDTITLKASLNLMQGNVKEIINTLEPITSPERLSIQNSSLLIQAYSMQGMIDKAIDFTQISIYLDLISMISISTQYLSINIDNMEDCIKTINRIDKLIEIYSIIDLHPNISSQFYYQTSLNYMRYNEYDKAIRSLELFVRIAMSLFNNECTLHGDDYFNRLDKWIDKLTLGANPPRDKSFIKKSIQASFDNPSFNKIKDKEEFKKIINMIE